MPALASVTPLEGVQTAAPAHLGPEGRTAWERVVGGCVWLAETDHLTLKLACEKIDRREHFARLLAESDPVLFTDKAYAYPNPLVGMLSTIENEIAKLFGVLGLTPADRTRMGVAEVKAKNAFEEMLARRQNREQ
jgi:P27 family predicted phage terminase small subunit